MSRFIRSGVCEAFTEELSAFQDGELPFPESLAAMDHLATCEGCRRFYLDSRRLSERLLAGPKVATPEVLWERIAERSAEAPEIPIKYRTRRRQWAAGLAIAAGLILALALSQRSFRPSVEPRPGVATSSQAREVVIEGAKDKMTDERFISLLAEILSADKKYHRETERVLKYVLGRENPVESDDRDAPSDEDRSDQEGSREGRTLAKSARLPS
jgi:hypothetical protein